jgi:uncharacterized RDD family membrane protein YckC
MMLDAAVINLVAVIVGVGASLILSILHLPSSINTVLAGVGAAADVLLTVGYFIVFWSTTGQTPGARVMQFRVVTASRMTALKPRQTLVRCAGVVLAATPLFAGFFLILFDDKRRGLQDRMAGTVVIEAPQTSFLSARAAARVDYESARSQPMKPPP